MSVPNAIKVDGIVYQSKHILIATGDGPRIPNILGKSWVKHLTIFNWQELPASVIILWRGYIAVELAGVLQTLWLRCYHCTKRRKTTSTI